MLSSKSTKQLCERCARHRRAQTTYLVRRHLRINAPAQARVTDKSRILEKPAKFNPPSHGSRKPRPRRSYGPALSDAEIKQQQTKRYPHTMPQPNTFMHWFLTNRGLHLFITLGTLTSLAGYAWLTTFLHTTEFYDEVPSKNDLYNHPIGTISRFIDVYKRHTLYESEKVAAKRREKISDAAKRKEFLREHGVEPGFLTGTWMDKLGTIEGDRWKEERAARLKAEQEAAALMEQGERMDGAIGPAVSKDVGEDLDEEETEMDGPDRRKKKKINYRFLGISWN